MPRFSVLLPTHNRADVLPYAIQSVLDQTEEDFELLVVNDGSTDGTAELARSYDDPRIRWFDLPKAPHFGYANRNVVLRQARGDLIAFAAHDDLLFPDHLALLAERFRDPRVEFAYSIPLWAMPDGTLLPVPGNLDFPDELDSFLGVANFMPAYCVVHRRSCLERYGYWPEDVPGSGDWVVWRAIVQGGGRKNFAYLPVPTGLHFKAIWRTRSAAGAEAMNRLAADAQWWPESLRLGLKGGRPEQIDFAEAMRAGAQDWVTAVRAGTTVALGRLALDQLHRWSHDQAVIQRLTDKVACVEGVLRQRSSLLNAFVAEVTGLSQEMQAKFARLQETPPPEFDEEAYLARNPDVAAAIAKGIFPSGYSHWCRMRSRETRSLGGS